jgi:hypothetical protein
LSLRHSSKGRVPAQGSAPVFAALGDETRLRLVAKVTRQAITKHLYVMEHAGLVHCTRRGRESIWQLDHRRLEEARRHLELISKQWDAALARLRQFVED